jgi:hypothetical protein
MQPNTGLAAGQVLTSAIAAESHARHAPKIQLKHAATWIVLVLSAVTLAILDGQHGWLSRYSNVDSIAYCSLWVLLLALGCEFMDATIGMGYGTTLVPLLFVLNLPPAVKEAALLSQLLANISATFFHHSVGNFNLWKDHTTRNTGLIMGGIGLVVAVGAEMFTISLPQHLLRPGITIMVIAIGVFMLVAGGFKIRLRMRNVGILAGIAGFNKAFSGGGYGPLVAGGQVLVGLPVRAAVATTAIAEAIVCAAAVTTYYAHGKLIPMYLLLPMCVGALLSTPLSAITLRRLPTGAVKKTMAIAIIILGAYALYQGKGI